MSADSSQAMTPEERAFERIAAEMQLTAAERADPEVRRRIEATSSYAMERLSASIDDFWDATGLPAWLRRWAARLDRLASRFRRSCP